VDLLWQQLRRHHDRAGEQRAEEEAEEGDGDGGDEELGHEPEDEVQGDADDEVDGHAEPLAEALRDEAEGGAADGHAGPEAGARVSGGVAGGLADTQHEGDDPASEANCVVLDIRQEGGKREEVLTFDAHVGEEEEGAEPCDLVLEGYARAYARLAVALVLGPEGLSRLVPEGNAQTNPLKHRHADLSTRCQLTRLVIRPRQHSP
jgi:hypothetical protein